MRLQILAFAFLSTILFAVQAAPSDCFAASTKLESLITCFDDYTVRKGTYDFSAYTAAQPTLDQRAAYSEAITALLNVNGPGGCVPWLLPHPLLGIYTISLFRESSGKQYCVLSETNSGVLWRWFEKGWGTFIVPATRNAVSRNLHISAPHPQADRFTPKQAAVLFRETGAKSLLVAGRHKEAFEDTTPCVTTGGPYFRTDATHDTEEAFFDAQKSIRRWQNAHGGCPPGSCAYLQMHAKSDSVCSNDNVFLSSGLGNSPWYTDDTDRPVKRIQRETQKVSPWTIALPSDDPGCPLVATDDIFGRLVNGVNESDVCDDDAAPGNIKGQFVHIESDTTARGTGSYDEWAAALKKAFATTCAPGLVMDPTTLLCKVPGVKGGEKHVDEQTWHPRGRKQAQFFHEEQ